MAIEAICRSGNTADEDGAPSGHYEKLSADLAGRDAGGDIEQLERKRKTRRRKTKRKNPYSKIVINRGKKPLKTESRGVHYATNQPVAPYNSNQFLIEDHNDLQDFDVKLMAVTAANRADNQNGSETGWRRTGRQRDPSFTSAESDQEFYSSPEDEEEFLTKEFSNTYRDLHVESLAAMSKPDLIQLVLQLEDRIEGLDKKLKKFANLEEKDKEPTVDSKENDLRSEIHKLANDNAELRTENAKLRQQQDGEEKMSSAESSEDSESDSSTSSDSSEISDTDNNDSPHYEHINGDMDCEGDVNIEPANVT